ncbi:MAG: sigma-70 family RNA polymerase sigma factor [Firmicutes bacterium]|jgi:RNA polymerase sporulation-specific sigma factor|nr:sigma-70 family RNA polymerase sigma factor [Bacillota bacterium]MDH7494910.1 sigma-70 family RNA polymerase sigma factor [Bacillota bacterium]
MSDTNQELDMELLMRSRSGQEGARDELIRKYVPMVRHIVRTTAPSLPVSEFEDLIQDGLVGLLDAIRQYDPGKPGVKFSSFAYLCIIRKIYNSLRRHTSSKQKALNQAISLYSYVDKEETRMVLDLLAGDYVDPEAVVENEWASARVEQVLRSHLSMLEYAVTALLLRGYTTGEIGRAMGLDPKSVDNARTRVKAKLRRLLHRYGSLVHPEIPSKARRRRDLCMEVHVGCMSGRQASLFPG